MTPAQAKAAYKALVGHIAAQRDEFTHPQQLGTLTNQDRATILQANPDVLNDWSVTSEGLADIFLGHVTADLYVSATLEPLLRRWLFWDVQQQAAKEAERLAAQRFDADDYSAEPLFT